ncbi:S26 family signal peptidase [Catellatospora methionotrophica]|uniref:S26 family signal peptidase n=1 Tax=Catellatospora methionotrophica TaxID=121620 RepID=A0A8J3PGU4_9ACTN|nr:S26 family signal peptidase [Catellatospora methionotrophica]GIG16682.1 S26 family signal peptidase [Catellatospora methionotrophica]
MWTVAVAGLLIATVCVVLVIRRMRGRLTVVTVHGQSMAPALHPGDRVLVRRTALAGVRSGDVVMVARPSLAESATWTVPGVAKSAVVADDAWADATGAWLIKRVVAVPGDEVPRDTVEALRHTAEQAVPPGRFVAVGDNAELSFDSRTCGYFTDEQLWGLVVKRLEPAVPPHA